MVYQIETRGPISTESKEAATASQLAIVTMTFYPKWYSGEITDDKNDPRKVDKIRGDLALRTVKSGVKLGYQVVVTESGSCQEFRQALGEIIGAKIVDQEEKGMAAGRRQGYVVASHLSNAKAIMWTEPEKAPLITDQLLHIAAQVIRGEADVVVPHRTQAGFDSLPPEQTRFARDKFNPKFRQILERYAGVKNVDDFDMEFGPKIFRNDPEILKYFLSKYVYTERHEFGIKVKPEGWGNSLTLPIADMIKDGKRVLSIDVPYIHPPEQTAIESGDPNFNNKRRDQYNDQMLTLIGFLLDKKAQKTPDFFYH